MWPVRLVGLDLARSVRLEIVTGMSEFLRSAMGKAVLGNAQSQVANTANVKLLRVAKSGLNV